MKCKLCSSITFDKTGLCYFHRWKAEEIKDLDDEDDDEYNAMDEGD